MKLKVSNLKKSFGEKEVLHGISFSIESGKALGLLGRNGAGKTTTIRILMDCLLYTSSRNIYTFYAQSALTLSLESQRCDRQIC